MEDSWEESLSPDYKKNTKTSKPKETQKLDKLVSLDNKYKYQSSTPVKSYKRTYSDESIDKDILFSPTNSASDSGTPGLKKTYQYDQAPPTPKDTTDYLSNFAANSIDLDDSILGELLGGPKRIVKPPTGGHASASTKSTRSQMRLEPLDSDMRLDNKKALLTSPVTVPAPASSGRGGRSTAHRSSGGSDWGMSGEFSPMNSSPEHSAQKPSVASSLSSRMESGSIGGVLNSGNLPDPFKKRPAHTMHAHHNSFDFNDTPLDLESPKVVPGGKVQNEMTNKFFNFKSQSGEGIATNSSSLPNPNASLGGASSSISTSAKQKVTYADDLPIQKSYGGNHNTSHENLLGGDDLDMGGFVPSIMEPNRAGRRRRQVDTSPSRNSTDGPGSSGPPSMMGSVSATGSNAPASSKLDDLDLALGLSSVTAAPVTKKPVDPFSTISASAAIPAAAAKYAATSDSDSDSDTAMYRSKSRYGANKSFGSFSTNKASVLANTTNKTVSSAVPTTVDSVATSAKEQTTAVDKAASVGATTSSAASVSTLPLASTPATSSSQPVSSLPSLTVNTSHRMGMDSTGGGASTGGASSGDRLKNGGGSGFDYGASIGDSDDELDVSGIVRSLPDDLLLLDSSSMRGSASKDKAKSPFNKQSSSSANRRHSDGNSGNAAQKSSLEDSTSSVVSPHSKTLKKTSSLKSMTNNAESSSSNNHSAESSSASSNANNNTRGGSSTSISFQQSRPSGLLDTSGDFDGKASKASSPPSKATSHSPKAAVTGSTESSSAVGGLVVDRESKEKLRKVQAALENTQAEKDAAERAMRAEIEALKSKLATSASNNSSSAVETTPYANKANSSGYNQHHQPYHSTSEETSYNNSSVGSGSGNLSSLKRLHEQQSDDRRIIAQLELEICRLKDELHLKAAKHNDEVRYLKDRFETELTDVHLKNRIELEAIERRHSETMEAVRKVHDDEIRVYKEKNKSSEVFEQIAGSMKSTTGSIKYIEEQLHAKYKYVELQREGQIEARERLLAEMEEKARERVELAEAEGYKLKGILSHMEHVVSSLRSQGSEEKERLKQEHARLLTMQAAVEHEKGLLQSRNAEELQYVKQRSREVEIELTKLSTEKQAYYELVSSTQHKLELERTDFNAFVASTKRALESSEARAKEEDARLQRLRDEVLADKHAFEQRRAAAMHDISAVEEMKRNLAATQVSLSQESDAMRATARQFQVASEQLSDQQENLNQQSDALEQRELALREGFAQMKMAATQLAQRERDIQDSLLLIESQKTALDRVDKESVQRRLEAAAAHRDWLSSTQDLMSGGNRQHLMLTNAGGPNDHNQRIGFGNLPMPPYSRELDHHQQQQQLSSFDYSRMHRGGGHLGPGESAEEIKESGSYPRERGFHNSRDHNGMSASLGDTTASLNWKENFQAKLRSSYNSGLGVHGQSAPVPKELRIAQQALQQSRSALSRVTESSLNVQRSLDRESAFVDVINRKKSGASSHALL